MNAFTDNAFATHLNAFTRGAFSNAAGGFSPLSLSPLIWLDATQLGLSDGASVAQFTDLSGNGNHFVQATTSAKPTFRASGINGLASVQSDGVDDYMLTASFSGQAAWWLFMIMQPKSFPDYGFITILNPGDGSNAPMFQNNIPGNGIDIDTTCRLPQTVNTNYGWLGWGDNVARQAMLDSGVVSSAAAGRVRDAGAIRLFNRGDGYPASMLLGEYIYGAGVLTSQQKTALWTYASAKWGTQTP